METVRHNSKKDPVLHIETEGAIVNIRTGLGDSEGRKVTAVEVLADDASRGGNWHLDGSVNTRLIQVDPANPLTVKTVVQQFAELLDAGLSQADVLDALAARLSDEQRALIERARTQHNRDGELEIEDNALISESDDNGVYVLAWVWSAGPEEVDEDEDDRDGEEGGYQFDADYGLHVNGDEAGKTSARNLEVGDTFHDPAYDEPGDDWHTVSDVWTVDGTVHVDCDDEDDESSA